mmetsp:Transcript_96859/g.152626  ORF Transcript_96859/g.152626 Transcript_96859/m.152626 type:complete len:279 (-) Transcript_96859:9-845(-)
MEAFRCRTSVLGFLAILVNRILGFRCFLGHSVQGVYLRLDCSRCGLFVLQSSFCNLQRRVCHLFNAVVLLRLKVHLPLEGRNRISRLSSITFASLRICSIAALASLRICAITALRLCPITALRICPITALISFRVCSVTALASITAFRFRSITTFRGTLCITFRISSRTSLRVFTLSVASVAALRFTLRFALSIGGWLFPCWLLLPRISRWSFPSLVLRIGLFLRWRSNNLALTTTLTPGLASLAPRLPAAVLAVGFPGILPIAIGTSLLVPRFSAPR